ncbi:MAG TPA: hypothetical protein VN039_00115 [Nitrospira sp.]|nr:hypothetical protein [Nitrospira sp.]
MPNADGTPTDPEIRLSILGMLSYQSIPDPTTAETLFNWVKNGAA